MERPRFVHFAKLGSARTIHPRSSPASPASPCGAYTVAMAPLASSEPDIAGVGVKPSPPSVSHTISVVSPSPAANRVTLLREPVRRSGSVSSYNDLDRDGQSPLSAGASTIPRYSEHRGQRHDRSGSLTESESRRYQRQIPSNSSNSSVRNIASPRGAGPQHIKSASKGKGINTHNNTSNLTTPLHEPTSIGTASRVGPYATVRSPAISNTQTGELGDQRQRSSKTTDSAIPRASNTRPALYKQVNHSSESPAHNENQSSPQEIRRVLRSSPAFAQFHPKSGPSENGKSFSKLGRPNTAKTGSNPSFHSGLSLHDPTSSHHTRTSSETSLTNGDLAHTSSSLPVSHVSTPPSTHVEQPRSHSTQSSSANSSRLSRPQTSNKNRPLHLNLSSGTVTTSNQVHAAASQSARRIPQPAGRQAEISSASTPNSSQYTRGKTGPTQTPTKPKPKYYQRHADASKNAGYQQGQSARGVRTPNNGTPKKSPTERSKESSGNSTKYTQNVSSSIHTESPPSGNSPSKSAAKGQAHKQGFGFGYTCTANASIKRKQNNASTPSKQQVKPAVPRIPIGHNNGEHYTDPASTRANKSNGFTSDPQSKVVQDSEDPPLDPNAFQGGWKRNSMRLATQGYSSMSDLTKSIDCLILDADRQLSLVNKGDIEYDSLLSSDSCSSQNNTLSRNSDFDIPKSKGNDHKRSDDYYKDQKTDFLETTVSTKPSASNSQTRIPGFNTTSQSSKLDAHASGNGQTSPQKPKGQSSGIPIKQSYFANNSFILVPGVPGESCDGEARHTNFSSPSGSPSSGYSSSPAPHERRPAQHHDNYYEQQEHQNKIKRRSFVLATSSISDLSYYLDDVDTPVAPRKEKPGNFPSLFTVNEAFNTLESQRRHPYSLSGPESGHLNSSFGSFYSCQSQATPSPKLSPPPRSKSSDDKRGSFYDNCQDSPKQISRMRHDRDGYESETSTTESEYKTASTSSFVNKKDLNPTDRDERIRAKLLSRHWVRTTPYRHSRFSPDQALTNYNRYQAKQSPPAQRNLHSRTDQFYAQSSPKQNHTERFPEETRKSKDSQKSSKKSPSPPESRKTPKKRVTSPIAWCTSSRTTTENKVGKSPSSDQRKRSNSSPFPSGRLTPSRSADIPESSTSPALSQNVNQTSMHTQTYRCQAEAEYSLDFRNHQRLSEMSDSIDGDSGEFFDAESDERWSDPPRAPPSLGRPRRKEYAGFDSQPLPMDSFVSDSSSVYTDNTSTCSSRAPSRSADVESYSRRSSVASSTREFMACSRAYSSGASGVLTPRRQMSDDTICNDLSYQHQMNASQHLDDEAFPDAEEITLNKFSLCENTLDDFQTDRLRSQSVSSSKCISRESGRVAESKEFSSQLRGCISSQSQSPFKGHSNAAIHLPAKAQSCMVGRRTSDSSSRKSSTSGVSSDDYTDEHQAETQFQQQQQQQHQQKPLKGTRFCERVRGLT